MPNKLSLDDLPTPALVIDLDRLEENLRRMAERTHALDVSLRPHVKTHKCVEVGRMQVAILRIGNLLIWAPSLSHKERETTPPHDRLAAPEMAEGSCPDQIGKRVRIKSESVSG